MELSIVIPVKNDIKIKECIQSIDEEVEIVVAMNDPSIDVVKLVKGLEVKFVCIPEANLSKAYNAGIEIASYDRVLLMDSDCIFEKGTIRKLYKGSLKAKLSKGKVIFKYNSLITKVVSKVREFTTSDFCNAFSPPLIINKNIIEDIGYYFNPLLKWEEDYEFNQQIFQNKIKIYWDKTAVIYHPPLSIRRDLLSAYNYGIGHGIGIKAGIFIDQVENKKIKRKNQKMRRKQLRESKGICALLYYIFWQKTYNCGIKNVERNL